MNFSSKTIKLQQLIQSKQPMKVITTIKKAATLVCAGALGTILVASALAQQAPPQGATGGPGGPGGFGGPGGGGFGGRGGMRGGMGGGIDNNFLDEKQRDVLREAMEANAPALRDLNEKLRLAQKELVEAVIAEKYEDKVVREKADAYTKIQADMIMLRAKAFSSVTPTLTVEQKDKIRDNPMVGALLTSNFGMGGFGGRGGFDPAAAGFGGNRGGGQQPDRAARPDRANRQRGGAAPGTVPTPTAPAAPATPAAPASK
jgi:Spy/CpxP family protein refolding chaperone